MIRLLNIIIGLVKQRIKRYVLFILVSVVIILNFKYSFSSQVEITNDPLDTVSRELNNSDQVLSTTQQKELSLSAASFLYCIPFGDMFSGVNILIATDTMNQSLVEKQIRLLEKDKFKGSRTARWYYGWTIFKSYPWHKKILGGGFDYMELYGTDFKETKYDYPHNPFISAFLYSGIVGGFIYIWFMFLVFKYYIKYLKHHVFFFICFLVVFFFSFVSGNTHFSIPVFAILCIIPFFTRYLIEKELKEK